MDRTDVTAARARDLPSVAPMRAAIPLASIAILLAPGLAGAQAPSAAAAPPAHDVSALAKETQNPVSSLISIPFQFNFLNGGGLDDETLLNLNLQPVIPFQVGEDWKVIARTIVPIDSYPGGDGVRYSGVGDIEEQLFISPARPGPIVIGVGPMFSLPTATALPAQTGSWAGGVAAVVVKTAGPFVLGGLVTRLWTFADHGDDREVNQFLVQPFVNVNFGQGWALSTAPTITADYDAPEGEQWNIPLGLGISRTTVFNHRPTQLGVQYYYAVERPASGPAHQLRFVVSLLFPAGH
jgi:hypothetical protein